MVIEWFSALMGKYDRKEPRRMIITLNRTYADGFKGTGASSRPVA